ncbi:MAG: F-type H+-transporting ATPase subunit b [Rickettsiales bacterium]|jgi:F-type H+-transporting ATPase subunit b
MPQFDPSSFASQIFWLAICFGALYVAMSRVFLPRIRDIFQTRNIGIEKNNSISFKLQEEIDKIVLTSKSLKDTSASQYKATIEQFIKQAGIEKEKNLHNLKREIVKISEESKKEISDFKEGLENDQKQAIDDLANEIGSKFFTNKIN